MVHQVFRLLLKAALLYSTLCRFQNGSANMSVNAGILRKTFFVGRETHRCEMSINVTSARYLKNTIEVFDPNFARLEFRFRYQHPVQQPYILEPSTSHTDEAIRPYDWVWTYDSPDSFFPYLKWPVDFPILSFGLLDAKTLKTKLYFVFEIKDPNCRVTIGNRQSIISIALALRNFTKDYLVEIDPEYSFSYWCYLSEIPGVKETLGYKFGIYFAYPVEFARYNCCKTIMSKVKNSSMSILCLPNQVKKMWQGTIIPYILGLVAFAYFPIVIFSASARLKSIGRKRKHIPLLAASDDMNGENGLEEEFTILDGNPPISIMTLIGGLCGLFEKYPGTVSRFRRLIFVLFGPCLIFCQLYVYYCFEYVTTIDLIDHGCPLGYLSMLAGFEKSKNNFLPILGGPYVLLLVFYVAGFIFLIVPSSPDGIVFDGTLQYSSFEEMSILVLHTETIEKYSHLTIQTLTCGYKRAAAFNKAMFYALLNPKFWVNAVNITFSRFKLIYTTCTSVCSKIIVCLFLLPVYILVCVIELCLTILYYGVPVVNGICIILTGYLVLMSKFLRRKSDKSDRLFWMIFNNLAVKGLLAVILTFLLIYYMFSFCTIFICSFSFLAEVLVFSFISVIVYPATSFGYLFFGIVFLYYIFKTFQAFGDGYNELLADAVEVSSLIENDMYRNQIVDGTVIIDDTVSFEITKLQIRNKIINLSTDQRQAIRDTCTLQKPKVVYVNQAAGIPRDLFDILVKKYLPVHIQITHALLKIFLILALIYVTISIVVVQPYGSREGLSEMMHVVFIVAVGALPRVLEVALDNINHRVRKEIHLREVRETINQYWAGEMMKD